MYIYLYVYLIYTDLIVSCGLHCQSDVVFNCRVSYTFPYLAKNSVA